MQGFRCSYATAHKHTLVGWILFDDASIEDGFDDMPTLKTFFQGVLHRVASDKIVSGPYSLANDFDVHPNRFFVHKIARIVRSREVILPQGH